MTHFVIDGEVSRSIKRWTPQHFEFLVKCIMTSYYEPQDTSMQVYHGALLHIAASSVYPVGINILAKRMFISINEPWRKRLL